MDFIQPIQYQGAAQSRAFAPTAITSPTEVIAQNQAGQLKSLESSLAMERQNLDAVNRVKLNNQRQLVGQLSSFSKSLTTMLTQEAEKRNEADMQEGLMMAYMDGLDPAEAMAFDVAEGYLKQQDDGIQAYGDAVQASGAPFMGVQQIRNLSGWKQYGYAMGVAQNASSGYQVAMQQMLADLPGGLSSAEKAAYLSQARAAYFKQSGIMGINPALLNKYAFPGMREVDAQMLNTWRKQDEDAAKEEILGEAQQLLAANPTGNFGSTIDHLTRSGMTRGAARAQALKWLEDPDQIDSVGSQLSWDGKLTWEEKYPIEFREARRAAIRAEVNDYEISQAEKSIEGKKWFDQVEEQWKQNPPTEEEIDAVQRKMEDDFNYVDPRLDGRWKGRSTDAESKEYYTKQFQALDRAGQLTEAMLNDPAVPYDVRERFLAKAQQQDNARRDTPEFKQYNSQIKEDLNRLAKQQGLEPGAAGLDLAVAKAQGNFQRDMMEAINSGMSPEAAAELAYGRFQAEFAKANVAGAEGTGLYKFDETGAGFVNIIPNAVEGKPWVEQMKGINDSLTKYGSRALDEVGLIPATTVADAVQNINNPNYKMPALANYISQKLGGTVSPWEVLNRQAIRGGFGPLAPNPRLQSQTQGIRPELSRLLHYKPSYNRVARAYGSTGAFNPDRVPHGYGSVVLEAASANGVDPAILAGLIETESHFNPKARSPAGAVGIAQIMPGYHPTVDPTKPIDSIHYAAKYLKELYDQTGSWDEAIYAYNGGLGGIRKSAENRAYHPKVMRAAAKYGYNPTGNPWTNPAFLNPRLAYITGNIGPTSTGPHLDVKQVGGGNFGATALDRYVEVDDPEKGRVPLSKVGVTAGQRNHRNRGSHGIDYGTYSGTRVYLKGGAKVVGKQKTQHGDKVFIQLPNGQKYSFLHGRSA